MSHALAMMAGFCAFAFFHLDFSSAEAKGATFAGGAICLFAATVGAATRLF